MSRAVDLTMAQPRNGGSTLQSSSQASAPSSPRSNSEVMLPPAMARAEAQSSSITVRVMPSGAKMRSWQNVSSGMPAA